MFNKNNLSIWEQENDRVHLIPKPKLALPKYKTKSYY